MRAGIDVYGAREALDLFPFSHRANVVYPGLWLSVGKYWAVEVFEAVHDAPGSCGYIVRDHEDTLCFITDTAYVKYVMPACNIIMIEANYSESILAANVEAGRIEPSRAKRVRENHMSIARVLDFLKANDLSRCRAIHLLHLSDGNSNADSFKRMVQEATGIPVSV